MSTQDQQSELLFGRYLLHERVTSGRMAAVYRAEQRGVGGERAFRPVTVKRIKRELTSNPVFVDLFNTAARVAASLVHPNIVRTVEFGYVRDSFYFVQEYVAGMSLAELLKIYHAADGSLGPSLSSYIALEICKALEYAHGLRDDAGGPAPVLHRAISPRTVVLTIDGGVKLVDFGLALPMGVGTTSSDAPLEKLAFMSPEQASGRHDLDERSDLYSLGLVLYEILSGRPAFVATEVGHVIEQVKTARISPIESVSAAVPDTLARLVKRLLSANRDLRPASAVEVRAEIEEYLRDIWMPVSASTLADVVCTSRNVDLGLVASKPGMLQVPTRQSRQTPVPASMGDARGVGRSPPALDDDDDEQEESTTIELPTFPLRREVRMPCETWAQFLACCRENLDARGIELEMANPPERGALVELIFELPDRELLRIQGEVFKIGAHPSRFDVRRVSVALDLSPDSEARVRGAVERAGGAEGGASGPEMVYGLEPARSSPFLPSPGTGERPQRQVVSIGRATPILGIDLGTSYSSAAVIENGRILAVADAEGRVAIPSVVAFREMGDWVVGWEALELSRAMPERAVSSVKQLLARRADDPKLAPVLKTIACPVRQGADGAVELLVGDRVMEPCQIAALILGHIKDHAEEQLGRPIEKAVLAYPPSFDARQIAELQKAAKLAELQVAALVAEPMAVALAHHPAPDRHSVLGVADLGGGAVSFSVVNVAGAIHQLAGSASDPSLGGDQLSLALASVAAEEFRRTAGIDAKRNTHDWQRIVLECEKSKWLLSQETEVIVSVPLTSESATLFVATLQPAQFQQISKGWIDRAMGVCLRGLHEAGVGRRDLKEVVVTGGMARLPGLLAALRELFVFDPLRVATPELSVAIGAAVQGAKLEGLKVQPVRQTLDGRQPMASWLVTPGSQDVQPDPVVAALDLQVENGLDVEVEAEAGVEEDGVGLEPVGTVETGLPLAEPVLVPERPKHRVGSFDLLAEIGQDDAGTTYLSRVSGPEGVQQPVTVRILHEHLARDRAFLTGYLEAVGNAARLHHPAITQIFEHGEHGSSVYVAGECVSGAPLVEVRNRLLDPATGRMDPRVACHIAIQVAEGLHYAHEMTDLDGHPLELVHRDVSPQNIFVTYAGDVKLLDFGLPKPSALSRETPTAAMKSLFAYQSPEIIKDALIDRRSDVFALGINLWELLAGQSLFERATVAETIGRVIAEPVPMVSDLRPDIPRSLAAAIARALKRDRDERHQTAWDFHEALVEAVAELGGPVTPQAVGAMMERAFAEERERWLTLTSVALGQRPSQPPIPRPAGVLPPVTGESQLPDEEVPTDVYGGGVPPLPPATGLGIARTIPQLPPAGDPPGAEGAITSDWQPPGSAVVPSETPAVRATVPGAAGSTTRRRVLILGVVLAVLCVVSALTAYFVARWLGSEATDDPRSAQLTPSGTPTPPGVGPAKAPDAGAPTSSDAGTPTPLVPVGPTATADAGHTAGDGAAAPPDAAAVTPDAEPTKADAEAAAPVPMVTVTLKLRPPDATVFVDGVRQTDTKVLKLAKARTPVKIKAEAPGYYTKVVLVVPNQNRRQVVSLLRKNHRARRRPPPTTTRKTTGPAQKTTKTTKRTMWR